MRRLALLTLLVPSPALAQRPDTARADSAPLVLPAIGVTATREDRTPFAQPLAVTRVAAETRVGERGLGIDEALRFVPGVVAQSRSGGSDVRLVVRGFGARGAGDRSNSGTSRGVRVLLDGVPETEPDGRTAFDNLDLGLMSGIEVVRSNASALWGNAAGGVVSFTTLDPDLPRESHAEAMAGSYGLARAILRGTADLGRGAGSVRLAHTRWDGWRERSDSRRSVASAAAVVAVGESQASRLTFTATGSDNFFRIPGPLTRAQLDADPRQANPTYAARDERRRNRQLRLSAALDGRAAGGIGVSALVFAQPKALERSERGTFRDFTRYHVGGSVVVRGERSLGERARARIMAGADEAYQDGAILFYSLTPQGTRGDTLRDDKREGANNAGVFVQGELEVGSRLTLTAGARYDAIRYRAATYSGRRFDETRTFSGVVPKLGISWRPGRSHSIYFSVGGGIEAPAGNETDPAGTFGQDTVHAINPLLDPIRSTTWEMGTRRLIVARAGPLHSLQYDVALYYTAVRNEIVPYRGGRFHLTAGRAHRAGLEIGATAHGAARTRLDLSLSLSANEYDSYTVDSVHYGVPGAIADYAGNRVVGVPRAIWAVGFGWTTPGAPLTARLTVEGSSSYYADDANTISVPGYAVVHFSFGSARPFPVGDRLGVGGFVTVDNVLDARHVASAFLNPDIVNGEAVAFEPGLPRQLVAGLSLVRR